jgi:hypothetical protein
VLSGGTRRVVAEEATGVRCPQCPDGTRTLTSLQQTFKAEGRELIVISIHAAQNFSVPWSSSQYDFRSPDAQALVGTIGPLEGFPSSAIDRRLLANETSTFVNPHTRWEGVIREDFAKDYGLEVAIDNNYNPATRQLGIYLDLDVYGSKTLTGENYLTVLITQDSIVDVQDDKGVPESKLCSQTYLTRRGKQCRGRFDPGNFVPWSLCPQRFRRYLARWLG